MKKFILLAALALASSQGAFAQTFTAASGYSATLLPSFTDGTGFTITGLSADSAGNLYYLENGPFGGGQNVTRLYERTISNSFATPIQLFTYGTSVSGNFVKVIGNTVYFGEGTDSGGTIRSVATSGGTVNTLVSLAGNYDLASGISGTFVSADASQNPQNTVYKINLTTGALDKILSPTGDYSGALAVTATGGLLYGATAFGNLSGGIFSFTKAQVDAVTDANPAVSDTSISLTGQTPKINDGNNQYLAYLDDQHLYQSNSPFGSFATLTRFSLTSSLQETVGTTTGTDFLGALALSGSTLYTVVTSDFSNGPSAIYRIIAVPEPSSLLLAATAGGWLLARRRPRRTLRG